MPWAAVAEGNVHHVMRPRDIARELERIAAHPYAREDGRGAAPEAVSQGEPIADILALLRLRTYVDFSHYKQTTIRRRIPRRMAPSNPQSPGEYLALPRGDGGEVQNLYQDFLIRVTQFFREGTGRESQAPASRPEQSVDPDRQSSQLHQELAALREYLQSANEALATVNEELRHRNAELARVNNDLTNLLGGVNIPIVMVGRDLRIRRFTPMAERSFNLIPTDVGRPITDIKSRLEVPDLAGLITGVIDSLTPHEGEVRDESGRWYSLRVRPYVTLDNKIDGASIVLVDIDSIRGRGPRAGDGKPPGDATADR